LVERLLHCCRYGGNGAAERNMKIYLLIVLIGTLLAAVRFTAVPEQRPESLPQR
jgi:hypothetical protein